MDNQELIAKYKKQLENKYLDDDTKNDLRKKIKSLQDKTQEAKSEPSKEGGSDAIDAEAKKDRIAELKELLEAPLPPVAKKAFREELEKLQGEKKKDVKVTPRPKPKPKAKVQAKKEEKPIPSKVVRKAVKDKPERKKVEKPQPKEEVEIKVPKKRGRKPLPKVDKPKAEPKKRGRKPKVVTPPPAPAPKKVRAKKTYVPKVKSSKEEPDCDTLLKQFRARRRKAKEVQAKRKTTPVFRKIASDVVDAVEKAIKNVPAKTIKESPKETIKKFGLLKKSAEQFLSAFRGILGKEYARSEAEKELNELKTLIDKLIKKYKK
jgi:hypothetical protein